MTATDRADICVGRGPLDRARRPDAPSAPLQLDRPICRRTFAPMCSHRGGGPRATEPAFAVGRRAHMGALAASASAASRSESLSLSLLVVRPSVICSTDARQAELELGEALVLLDLHVCERSNTPATGEQSGATSHRSSGITGRERPADAVEQHHTAAAAAHADGAHVSACSPLRRLGQPANAIRPPFAAAHPLCLLSVCSYTAHPSGASASGSRGYQKSPSAATRGMTMTRSNRQYGGERQSASCRPARCDVAPRLATTTPRPRPRPSSPPASTRAHCQHPHARRPHAPCCLIRWSW